MDDRNQVIFAGVVVGLAGVGLLGYNTWKIKKTSDLLYRLVDLFDQHLEMDFQEDVDNIFSGMVNKLEDED